MSESTLRFGVVDRCDHGECWLTRANALCAMFTQCSVHRLHTDRIFLDQTNTLAPKGIQVLCGMRGIPFQPSLIKRVVRGELYDASCHRQPFALNSGHVHVLSRSSLVPLESHARHPDELPPRMTRRERGSFQTPLRPYASRSICLSACFPASRTKALT